MQLEDYFDFLASGDIRIRGHRIGIEDVLYEYIYNEMTPADLAARFPSLSLEEIYAALLYYHRKRADMDVYIANWLAFGDRMRAEQAANPTPLMLKLRQVREQRAALDELEDTRLARRAAKVLADLDAGKTDTRPWDEIRAEWIAES